MSAPSDIKSRLESLSIPRDSRPSSTATTGRGGALKWIVLFVIVAAAAALYFNWDSVQNLLVDRASKPDIKTLTVTARASGQRPATLIATGKIVSDFLVEVATKVSGQVVELHFEQGDRVDKGQLLARIEDDLYRAYRDEAAANLEKSRAAHEYEKINYARVEYLFKQNNAQPIELADARRTLDEAKAQVAADQAALDAAEKALRDCEVTAPIGGVILERNVEVGDFVAAEGGIGANANAQFGVIADMDRLRVEVDISELDIARIRKGMPCRIVPDAYKDRTYAGHVMWLDPGANYSKATVQAKVRIENPDAYLRVEGSAQVSFLPDASADESPTEGPTIWIPLRAMAVSPDESTGRVYVVNNNRLERREVKLGQRAGSEVQILSGLNEGETIVAQVSEQLQDGQRIPQSSF